MSASNGGGGGGGGASDAGGAAAEGGARKGFFRQLADGYDQLVDAVIRPPRSIYDPRCVSSSLVVCAWMAFTSVVFDKRVGLCVGGVDHVGREVDGVVVSRLLGLGSGCLGHPMTIPLYILERQLFMLYHKNNAYQRCAVCGSCESACSVTRMSCCCLIELLVCSCVRLHWPHH